MTTGARYVVHTTEVKNLLGQVTASASFSEDMTQRYTLFRQVGYFTGPQTTVLFIMLNPSTADAFQLDPTVRRCYGYAQAWGYSRLEVCNLFAYRATDPDELYRRDAAGEPIGDDGPNTAAIIERAAAADLVVCAWGNHGRLRNRAKDVSDLLADLKHVLRITKAGQPEHPLYLPKRLKPEHWDGL